MNHRNPQNYASPAKSARPLTPCTQFDVPIPFSCIASLFLNSSWRSFFILSWRVSQRHDLTTLIRNSEVCFVTTRSRARAREREREREMRLCRLLDPRTVTAFEADSKLETALALAAPRPSCELVSRSSAA